MFSSTTSTHIVILCDVGDPGGCPGDIRTLNCSVNNSALEWYCTDDVHRTIFCDTNDTAVKTITCNNQTLTPKFHECNSDDTTITSVVEINVSSHNTTWTCINLAKPFLNESTVIKTEGKYYTVSNI